MRLDSYTSTLYQIVHVYVLKNCAAYLAYPYSLDLDTVELLEKKRYSENSGIGSHMFNLEKTYLALGLKMKGGISLLERWGRGGAIILVYYLV